MSQRVPSAGLMYENIAEDQGAYNMYSLYPSVVTASDLWDIYDEKNLVSQSFFLLLSRFCAGGGGRCFERVAS